MQAATAPPLVFWPTGCGASDVAPRGGLLCSSNRCAPWLLGGSLAPSCHLHAQATLTFSPCMRAVGPLSGLSAHYYGVMQDLIFFDDEALVLMAPLNMDPKVSANRPSHQPQPPPLLTPAFIACAYFVPSGRLWHSIFSRAKYYM